MARQQWNAPPELQIDVSRNYVVSIETNRGNIELELYPQHAPQTVNNFVFLAGQGFYDGVVFHRVIANFMIQSGEPDRYRPRRPPGTDLPMSAMGIRSSTSGASFPWPTPGPIRTAASSLSPILRRLIWMANTRCSGR